jgi:hypothetical protein
MSYAWAAACIVIVSLAIKSAEKRTHAQTIEYALRLNGATVKMVVLDSDAKIISTK